MTLGVDVVGRGDFAALTRERSGCGSVLAEAVDILALLVSLTERGIWVVIL